VTVADDVLRALRDRKIGMTEAALAALLGTRHQHINQACRILADRGLIIRDGSRGEITNRLSTASVPPTVQASRPLLAADAAEDGAWDGNVQSSVVSHLVGTGWKIIAVADTAQRERGVDIIAERAGSRLLVEVTGWPSTTYARGERAGQPKPTQPSLQPNALVRRGNQHADSARRGDVNAASACATRQAETGPCLARRAGRSTASR
jgi:hypothetical protein